MADNEANQRWLAATQVGNGNHVEPASSILAAHLAPRLSSQGMQTQPLGRETFSQLRKELVAERYSQLPAEESPTDVNKLICIVLKAGLEPALADGATQRNGLKEQIFDCLDIVQAAVEKAPQALYELSDSELLGQTTNAPLFASVIVHLLHLSRGWECEDVGKKIVGVLSSMLHTEHRQLRPWPPRCRISRVMVVLATGP